MGVMSLMETTFKPWFTKVLTADSLPAPIPFMDTSNFSTPIFLQILAIASATLEAANVVDFLVPLNPTAPADLEAKTCPLLLVRVIMVLLYEEETYALPSKTRSADLTFTSFFKPASIFSESLM